MEDTATLESLQTQLQKAQIEISQKETKVAKLKSLLTRSMRSDKRREQQIETLQIDLADRDRHIQALDNDLKETNSFSAKQAERITQLEEELNEISNRLQSGVGSEAAQKRNERMKQMLERSNVLYAELQTKYQKVCTELEEEKSKHLKKPTPQKVLIISDDEAITLFNDGSYSSGPVLDNFGDNILVQDVRHNMVNSHSDPSSVAQPVLKVYLKRVLLEFFIGDGSTQERLIPVILQLLDCTPDQITAASRSYAEGRQIISKATSAFGF